MTERYVVVNNTKMAVVAVTGDMETALAWAETVRYQHDFSIISPTEEDLKPYTKKELETLYLALPGVRMLKLGVERDNLVKELIAVIRDQPVTSEVPPDGKRVAPIPTNEETEMATTTKKTSKKKATKKTAAKKTAAKKTATAKAPKKEKVVRERQNGVLPPKPDTIKATLWEIADELTKKAGEAAPRKDVVEAAVAKGINEATAGSMYQGWRRYHGLGKK